MEWLFTRLPKDVVNIIQEYAKDRKNYDKVVEEFNTRVEKSLNCTKLRTKQYYWRLDHRMTCPSHYEKFLWKML